MDTDLTYLTDLNRISAADVIGRKASALARAKQAGFRVPDSICLNSLAYQHFMAENKLIRLIEVEIGRKSMDDMRWEELWDCGLRIRNSILKSIIPIDIIREIKKVIPEDYMCVGAAVRSSSPQEDMKNASFAGLYDSYIGCHDLPALLDSVLKVWASLWSDRSLLYRREIGLDVGQSSMAFIIQKMVPGEHSGVAFSRDPNDAKSDYLMIEAVPGLCAGLVDGSLEPVNYKLNRDNLSFLSEKQSVKSAVSSSNLTVNVVHDIASMLLELEALFDVPVDVEWTCRGGQLTVLQVRPISYVVDANVKRRWYLTLTPNHDELSSLADEVQYQLIPRLTQEGMNMSMEHLSILSNQQLSKAINYRVNCLSQWREIYKQKFIPFAHGVREFGQYYNDVMKPKDPYEFTSLLKSTSRIATRRFKALQECYSTIQNSAKLSQFLMSWLKKSNVRFIEKDFVTLEKIYCGEPFVRHYKALKEDYFDISLGGQSWANRDDLLIELLSNFSSAKMPCCDEVEEHRLLNQYLTVTNDSERAKSMLDIGRLSWVLRDDDNLLLSKIESQLLYALNKGKDRLVNLGRLRSDSIVGEVDALIVSQALSDNGSEHVVLTKKKGNSGGFHRNDAHVKPRQIKGQPAVPGIASGYACRIANLDDIKTFNPGDIIICDAVDPNMTHLIPLARGVIERRGGMLIHGVIIARELGIPCVNGVGHLIEMVANGDYITIDGTMGLVIVRESMQI